MNENQFAYEKDFERIKGRTVALVYIFEGENAPGFSHYHVWKGNIIAGWLNAIQILHCRPFILDVRTFVEKGLAGTLPHIDYVVNLNCGSIELSPMGLIPSACAFLGIPCIPCDTTGIIVGENKRLSNFVAQNVGLTIPPILEDRNSYGIYRPLNYGSSFGVKRALHAKTTEKGLYQEFIIGLDITTPYVYNPLLDRLESLPTVAYIPNSGDLNWFLGEAEKEQKDGYSQKTIHGISDDLNECYLQLMHALNVKTFCRIDGRIRCDCFDMVEQILEEPLKKENLAFIEINTMPTVSNDNSFSYSFRNINEDDNIFQCVSLQQKMCPEITPNSFLLACSMISYLRAKC